MGVTGLLLQNKPSFLAFGVAANFRNVIFNLEKVFDALSLLLFEISSSGTPFVILTLSGNIWVFLNYGRRT